MSLTDPLPPRIFLECTRTWRSSLHTGIERVVRHIVDASQEVGRSLGVHCQPVVYHPLHGFVPVPLRGESGSTPRVAKPVQSDLKRRLEQWGLMDIARTSRHGLQSGSFAIQSLFQPFSKTRLRFHSRDILLLLDSSWTVPYWNEVGRAQRQGAAVGAVLYDLLPLQTPDSFTSHQLRQFHFWWNKVYHHVDFIASISDSVSRDVLKHHQRVGTRKTSLPGGAFRLGADFLNPHANPAVRGELLALANRETQWDAQPFYICVGTLSPRKQQSLVLDAFERLWSRGVKATLLYIGGSGWHSEPFIRRLRNHPEWGTSLFWRDDLNDSELNWCYRRAAGLVTASLGEGFNLPIVEALHNGCSVIASDIPVHREVGGSFACYFPKEDAAALARIIQHHSLTGTIENTPPLDQFRWPNWNASCMELLQLIQRLSQERQTAEPVITRHVLQ